MSVFNILFLVFWTFFLTSAVLAVLGYHKKNRLMEYISKPAMYVFLLTSSLMILIPNIPDSINIIIFVSAAIICGLAGACLQFLPKKRKIVLISAILFVLSFSSYTHLLFPSFRLFHLPFFVTLIISLVYAGLFAAWFYFILGKRSLAKTIAVCVFFAPLLVLHYASILTMCGQFKLYSVMLFAGSTVFLAANAMIVKGFFIKASDRDRLLRMILYVAGNFFVAAGFTLMVAF